jgi:hypothetical protein
MQESHEELKAKVAAKDRAAGLPPYIKRESPAMDEETRDLLTALSELLNVPSAARYEDRQKCRDLESLRRINAKSMIDAALEDGAPLSVCAKIARQLLEQAPVTYEPWKSTTP